ncbi:hypothetical protein ACHAWO_005171 [Cyclotella atomus]|uniref:Uncharacterized protein n=1 Tax=Cyclotella atomus TaxID=382360 RepID=A0ABD3NAC3_9STRA
MATANPSIRACLVIVIYIALNASPASPFSAVRENKRVLPSSFNFISSGAHSDNAHRGDGTMVNIPTKAAAAEAPNSSLFARSSTISKRMRSSSVLPSILRFISGIKRSMSRAIAIFSFAFLATLSSTRPAGAWGKTAEVIATKVEAPSSANKRCLKCIVTTVAVAAGAATANKVRGLDFNSTNDEDEDVPIIAPIEAESPKIVIEPPKPKPKTHSAPSNVPLVKDLDAKIERLREQEMLAIKHAADNIAKGEAAKAEQMAKAAAESEKNRVEERIAKIAEEEANRIAAIEKEREGQLKIAKEKIAALERERLERIAEEEAKVDKSKIEREMEHKVTQSSEPSHADESRMLVEGDAANRKEQERLLSEKYASISSEEERAFNILVDLGMVELHPDEFDDEDDDNIDSSNVFL